MPRYIEIAFTAYAVTNMARARKFYEGKLGLKPSRVMGPNFIEYDLGPHTLSVGCAPEMWKPSPIGTVAALEVADFDEAVREMKRRRVPFAIPVQDSPVCRMFGVRDPDENLIVLHKRKTAAEQKAAKKSMEASEAKAAEPGAKKKPAKRTRR